MFTMLDLHKKSIYNKEELDKVDLCGCFYCCEVFDPSEIKEYTDNGNTALCPYCKVDSVIPLNKNDEESKEILQKMYGYFFKD